MHRDDRYVPSTNSLFEIHSHRLCSEGPSPVSSLPPKSGMIPQDLLKHEFPRINIDPDSKNEMLQLSETESIPIDPNDDGGHDTQLSYPHNVLLQLARIKNRREMNPGEELSRIDMTNLLRIANSFTSR